MNKNGIKRGYSYREFLNLFPFCTEEHQRELLMQLEKARKPMFLAGVEVPADLNLVSYGLLDDIATIARTHGTDPMSEAIAKILDIDVHKVFDANVFDVFGMSVWIGKEIDRINKLFSRVAPKYTEQELAAGVKNLNFGTFGILDWYSKRQGISDQNLVRDVAWVRIYTCMKNDNEVAEYQKRLNKEYSKQYQAKSNGKYHR